MPKSLKFILVSALFIVCLLTIYRVCISFVAFPASAHGDMKLFLSYGLMLDLKIVGLTMLIATIVSNIPKCHFYKDSFGKILGYVIFALAGLLIIGYYFLDVSALMSVRQRLDYDLYQSIMKNDERGQIFRHKFSWTTYAIIVAIGTWIYTIIIMGIHGLFKKSKVKKGAKTQRYIITGAFIIASLLMIRGSITSSALTPTKIEELIKPINMNGAINPIVALFYKYSLPKDIF